MKQKRIITGIVAILVAIGVWAAFRPELIFINHKVNEAFPGTAMQSAKAASDTPQNIASGEFHGVAHETKGKASIYRLSDGKHVLRLSDFATANGPDVRVYLIATDDAKDNTTVKSAGFIELGKLKGNQGNQNYEVPADTDLNKYRAVTIWCVRFGVNFATAPLKKQAV